MLKKKCMSFFLAMLMVFSAAIFSAGTVAAETKSAMRVAANDSELAVKTDFSDERDHVQRIGHLFRPLNDPARTNNFPVEFGQTYLIDEGDTDLWTIDTQVTGNTQNTQDEATPFMINGSYIGANHGQNSGMYVTVSAHGLGYADVGSRWTTTVAAEGSEPMTIHWNLLRIVDANTLLFLSDGTFKTGAYTYGFSTNLSAGDTMNRADGAAKQLTVEKVSVNQVFPAIRHTKKTAYAVSDGLKWKIEPNTARDCDYVVIEESYQIIDPSTVADAIRANAPAGGYTANPDLTVGGDPMLNYNVVYTFLPDGTVLTESNCEVLKTIRIDSYGLIQYPKRADYAGGGIYRYLPNTKAFTAQAASGQTEAAFDFSVPTKIVGEGAADYPNSYTYPTADCVDTTYPNERVIDFFSDGSKDAATYASGYLPLGMGTKENLASTSKRFYFYNSLKAYPNFYGSAGQDGSGTTISGVAYKKLYVGGRSDQMNVYTVPYGDTLYTYVDMFANGKSYTLPAGYAIVNQSANVTIDDAGVATANFAEGDTHGYIVVSSANAEETAKPTAEGVLAQLTNESISSEPLDFVTKDLVIPAVQSGTGVTLTWESSNENVIAANGTVIRPMLTAETVTLKATASDANGTREKSFTITVAPLTVKEISTNNNFASGVSGWSSSDVTATVAGDEGNHYASFKAPASYTSISTSLPSFTNVGSTGTYTVEYKVQLPANTTAGEIVCVDLRANGKAISSLALTPGKLMVVDGVGGWYSKNGVSSGAYTAGDWATFKTIIDTQTKTRRIFYNGKELALSAPGILQDHDMSTLAYMGVEVRFRNAGSSATPTLTLMMDDLKVYTEDTPETYVQRLSDAEKVAWVASLIKNNDITTENHIAVTQNLTLNAGYSAFDLEKCGIAVNWTSGTPNVISSEGVVTGGLGAQTVTMTANITAGTASDTVSIPLVVVQPDTTAINSAKYALNDFEGGADTVPSMSDVQLAGGTVAYTADADASHGTVLQLKNTNASKASYSSSNQIYGLAFNRRYFMNFDMKYERMTPEINGNAYGGVELLGVTGSTAGSVTLRFDSRKVGMYTSLVRSNGSIENAVMLYDMPAGIQEGEWVTVSYDYNAVSRTYQVYLNGELINDIPLLKANIQNTADNHPLRGFTVMASQDGTVSMDNLSIRQSDEASSVANGGLNAALITYASADQRNALTAETSLQPTGPSTSKGADNLVATDYAHNPGMYKFAGGATLTYMLDGQAVTSINPAVPESKALTISSTYNGITETKTVQRQMAPVSVDSITAGETLQKVTLSGTLPTEGKVVVATYTNNGMQLSEVQIFDAAAVLTPNMSMSDIDTVKVFVMNSATDLRPVSHVKLK